MSVDYEAARGRWRVRWREGGRQRTRRFTSYEKAREFDREMSGAGTAAAAEQPTLQ